jgi:hypothetical protein
VKLSGERINDASAQSRQSLDRALWHTNAVIGNRKYPIFSLGAKIDSYCAGPVIRESMFEGVDHKLGNDKTEAYGRICCDYTVINRRHNSQPFGVADH